MADTSNMSWGWSAGFNHGRFNYARFNMRVDMPYDIITTDEGYENIDAMVVNSVDVVEEAQTYEQFLGKFDYAMGVLAANDFVEAFDCIAQGIAEFLVTDSFSEAFNTSAWMSLDTYYKTDSTTRFNSSAWMGKDVYSTNDAKGEFKSYARMGLDVRTTAPIVLVTFEVLVTARGARYYTFTVNTTIPAKGILTIDSDTYNVLLNGANIIHLHKGDWFWISRKSLDLKVTLDSGNTSQLSNSIIYTEAWL